MRAAGRVICCTALVLSCCDRVSAADRPKLDAARAFRYLKEICDLGPRISGTDGMVRQRELLETHFTRLGATVGYQEFDAVHPQSGVPVRLVNMVVSWHPERTARVLLCCHYDTRPFPDNDPVPANRTKPFIGANDGASGVALFMELGHHLPQVQTPYGVDFVFFDAEELIYNTGRDKYFLGSTYFATQYRDAPPEHQYVCGVLVDMIADKELLIFQEKNSLMLAPAVTRSVWEAATRAGVREFIPRRRHEIRDDHLPLNEIAKIPTCDVIDFDYPHWHTRNDVPAACSGESIVKVGRVLLEWLPHVPATFDR
jgi:glutaminyl-peptide cyclotransferase